MKEAEGVVLVQCCISINNEKIDESLKDNSVKTIKITETAISSDSVYGFLPF